ncbi:Nisin biosynthesis protein NisB [Chryseobacterium aquaeductus]|uniref:Nisin biosynthesis protein NisB n=1 Tax=Chryseobacterium aquaeductus TaxID=2675056 RepID=A0A9N8MG03_9FLAO|nr:lantibiotic dehydratase family protein [Chryseobacterium aquaeductus]CAA7330845.1 Nisin biosynthesis protein NisB [Chryseobacterium potabilaquae]CAD7806488.1 Nisin biosynthesis protein NisB [Chryseobacterium aquaeductus]
MPQFPYRFFEEYIDRTPIFSHKNLRQKFNTDEISDLHLKEICEDLVFQEAIYLASPNLHKELKNCLDSEKELSSSQHQKLKNTILKYYTRMSTRCTPFGLFSGVGLGKFSNETLKQSYQETKNKQQKTDNQQQSTDNQLRDTKLDMHLLVSLAKTLEKNPDIKNQLQYFPNNSIYKVGKKIRYVEYEYKEGKRDYIISSAPLSEELQQVLDFTKYGKTISETAKILITEEITHEEAKEFLEELIDNQVLVSELEPNVSGYDFLDVLISVLNKIEAKNETKVLVSIKEKLNQVDLHFGNLVSLYLEIEEQIATFKTDYEQKYLFQTDLYFKDEFNISTHWKKEIKKGLTFLNKITSLSKDTPFEHFKKAFYERFETQEMPLSYVLDTEIGIGYLQNKNGKGIHPYIEDLKLPSSQQKQNLNIQLTPFQRKLNEKLQEALVENEFTISLNDDDLKDFEEKWHDLPHTLSIMAEIISENNQEKLCIGSVGGSSAANLLGRFCSEKSSIQHLAKEITKKEAEYNSDEILAEIIHLPEARIGNIIRRSTLRQYEIPYLATSVLPEENQILVDDLYISLKNDRISLRSKKLNKEIKPCLTNAHNYQHNALPVYHFLCDFHSQNTRTGLYFNWGGLSQIHKFLPRIEYKNIILSKAQWNITEKDIASLDSMLHDKNEFLSKMKIWRNKRQVPHWIQWIKSDNTLPMNLENYDLAKIFVQTIKSEKSITIEEFLYDENDDFRREFIFPMYKEKKEKS